MRALRPSWLTLVLTLAACEAPVLDPPARCVAVSGDPLPSAPAVCARLASIGCHLDDCPQAYARFQSRTDPAEFQRLGSCYMRAADCDQVSQCERACGPDGGPVRRADAATDASTDASTDAADVTDASDVVTVDRVDVSLQRDDVVAEDHPDVLLNVPDAIIEDRPDVPPDHIDAAMDVPDVSADVTSDAGSDAAVDAGADAAIDAPTDIATD